MAGRLKRQLQNQSKSETKQEGTKPLMDIRGGMPDDLDYDWYINRCRDLFYPKR